MGQHGKQCASRSGAPPVPRSSCLASVRLDHDDTRTWAGETMQVQNIPTDLLRTLIAVVDLRSFTKAAQMLGVTQPAVSAQIKRLQSLIGYELLDKSAPGVSLTQRGVTVVAQARRLLAINDEILQVSNGNSGVQTLRVGIPGDYSGSRI